MKQFVYADNAATTHLDIAAFEAMKPYLLSEYGNASQPYSFSRPAKKALRESRQMIARCIGADPEEIYFTSGGTESDNWALKAIAYSSKEPIEILTSSFEHHAILHTCKSLERVGHTIIYIKPSPTGILNCDSLKDSITKNTKLVSIMCANNELGTIQPIKELCSLAHDSGALFHTDAVQAVGHIPIDVKELGIDMLSASAHKFNGPKGIGFLYVRKGLNIPSYLDGGAQENGLRAGTESVASIVGMAVALSNNCHNMDRNIQHVHSLESLLLSELETSGIAFQRNGAGNILPGVLNLSFRNVPGEVILHRLDLMGICVSTGSACDSQKTQISHVLRAIDLCADIAQSTIRISLGKDNSKEDVQKIVCALTKILNREGHDG